MAQKLQLRQRAWQITLNNGSLSAKNVVLAMGSEPKTLNYPNISSIPLEIALDKQRLQHHCDSQSTVAVFGASHSAILILRNLLEHPVKRVINFYRAPLCYALPQKDWTLFDNTGLKGGAAEWAREHIDGNCPAHLTRLFASPENIAQYLPECQQAIYAIGFAPRILPLLEDFPNLEYSPHHGIIAPGLFGLGIAFPEAVQDRFGMREYQVGLWKFMDYLHRVLPLWLQYST